MIFSKGNLNAIRSGYLNQNRANQQVNDYAVTQGTPRSIDLGQGEPLTLGQRTSYETQEVFTDPQFAINSAIAVISEVDRPALVRLLQRQGSFVTPLSSKKAIIDASFKAIQDSPVFRKKLQDYIVEQVTGTDIPKPKSKTDSSLIRVVQNSIPNLKRDRLSKIENISSNFSSFSDFDDNFANAGDKEQTKVGALLSTIFSQENINTAVGLGMQYASTRLNANAQKGTNQQAIDFEKAKTDSALAQAKVLEAQGKLPQVSDKPSGDKKWVMPVAIGGGILVLGTIIYFVMKKKK
jgi:hypothetical protein